jgi:Short C-terminal domain
MMDSRLSTDGQGGPSQAQQLQIDQAQAAQATQAAQAAKAHAFRLANQLKRSNEGKRDTFQELQKLGSLKQQGILTDEEFQKLKAQLLTNI